jgi:hypothetical protein
MVRRVSIGGVGGGGLWLVVLLTSEVVMGDGYAVCDEECA